MVKSKPHQEFWAGIHLPLEPVTVLGLLAEDLLVELASGLPPSLQLAAAPLTSGLTHPILRGLQGGPRMYGGERGHHKTTTTQQSRAGGMTPESPRRMLPPRHSGHWFH